MAFESSICFSLVFLLLSLRSSLLLTRIKSQGRGRGKAQNVTDYNLLTRNGFNADLVLKPQSNHFIFLFQACPLNPAPEIQSEQEFSQRFADVIRGVIEFAGKIPGFELLTQSDKFTLLKAGLFDALFVRLIGMFDTSMDSIVCLNGQLMRRDSIQNGANARFLVDSTFKFAERINAMQLTDAEVALFCAVVLVAPDRHGIRNYELINRMHTKLKQCLQHIIVKGRPNEPEFMGNLMNTIGDLKTLSTLHTEKLIVFRNELSQQLNHEQQVQVTDVTVSNWKTV